MPTTLIDGFSTYTEFGNPQVALPFKNYPTPDIYAKTTRREYQGPPADFASATPNRTSYTNLVTYSDDLTNAAWTKTNCTITAAARANPLNGTVDMVAHKETAANNSHQVDEALTLLAQPYVFSAIAASGLGRDWVKIQAFDGTTVFRAYFNIATGVVATATNCTGSIKALGFGAYRCSIAFTAAAGSGGVYLFPATADGVDTYLGDITKGVYWGGVDLFAGTSAGPHIPTTSVARTISAPDIDTSPDTVVPADPFAYLADESDPVPNSNGTLWQYAKTFARIPADQIRYASRVFTKPVAPNRSAGTPTFIEQGSSSDIPISLGSAAYYDNHIFAPDDTIYGPFRSATYTAPVSATGGTYTITYKSSTTGALAYNASTGTIATAVNALADVISDGFTVGASTAGFSNLGIVFTLTTSAPISARFTINAASLTGVTVAKAFTYITSGTSQRFELAGKFGLTAHGLNTSLPLVLGASTIGSASSSVYSLQPATSWSSIDANNIAVIRFAGDFVASSYALLGQYLRDYTPGSIQISSRITEKFYLPGVSVGITTTADIPLTQPFISDDDVLAAVLGSSGMQPVDFEGPSQWLGPIARTVVTEIDLDDI
jgi:hypothetical protein